MDRIELAEQVFSGLPTLSTIPSRPSVVSRYQLGFAFHAGSLTVPPSAFTPHGTWESAMNAAFSALTSPANDAGNLVLSSSK